MKRSTSLRGRITLPRVGTLGVCSGGALEGGVGMRYTSSVLSKSIRFALRRPDP